MELDHADCKSQPGCCVDDIEAQRNSSNTTEDEQEPKGIKGLGWLDRLLALWILLAMIIGILLGNFVDNVGPALHKGEFVGVSIPIGESHDGFGLLDGRQMLMLCTAIGLLVMMYPILCKVKFESLHHAFASKELWIQVGFSILLNWIVAPFLMVSPMIASHCYNTKILIQNG